MMLVEKGPRMDLNSSIWNADAHNILCPCCSLQYCHYKGKQFLTK